MKMMTELQRRELERQFRAMARFGIVWDIVVSHGEFRAIAGLPACDLADLTRPTWSAKCWLDEDLRAMYGDVKDAQFADYQQAAEDFLGARSVAK